MPLHRAAAVIWLCIFLLVFSDALSNKAKSRGTRTNRTRSNNPLKICTFNVQIFGPAKLAKANVMDVLVKIFSAYDICFIQEIRDSTNKTIAALVKALTSASGETYAAAVSTRLGRTDSKEQYAYIYKKSKVNVLDSYVYDDVEDIFEREPLVIKFNSPSTSVKEFIMIGLHAKPTDAASEISALAAVYDDAVLRLHTTDAVIMGDLNAACSYVSNKKIKTLALRTDMRFKWLVPDTADTTVASGSCAYDRLIVAGSSLQASATRWNVVRFDTEFALTQSQAELVSDHYPVELAID